MFAASASLTHDTARAALDAGLARIAAGDTAVDCAPLAHFDSSALAVLLAWRRAAEARGAALEVVNLPSKLESLAHAYGIAALIQPTAEPTSHPTAQPAPHPAAEPAPHPAAEPAPQPAVKPASE